MNYKKAYILSTALRACVLLLVLILTGFRGVSAGFIAVVAAALFAGSVIVSVRYYRCPHCGSMLPPAGFPKEFCKKCGEKLDK